MRTRSLVLAALTLLPTLLSTAQAQPAFMVKDIGGAVSSASPFPVDSASVELDGVLYFPSDDGVDGLELWRSDGTTAGTRLIKDLCPGICSSLSSSDTYSAHMTIFQRKIYWTAWNGLQELLFASDGTVQGTAPVFGSLYGRHLIPMGEAGGRLLLSVSYVLDRVGEVGELWATDGTAAGTISLGTYGTYLEPMGRVGNVYVFSVQDQLWATDGTAAGTVRLRTYGTHPDRVGKVGNVYVFGAQDQLWATDGTAAGTVLLSEMSPNLRFGGSAVAGGKLFFGVTGASTSSAWVSDGTPAGTRPLAGVSFDFGPTAAGSQVFFFQGAYAAEWELWKSDGTLAGTVLVKAFPVPFGLPNWMALVGRRLFFDLPDSGGGQNHLWVSDGTEAGTLLVRQFSGEWLGPPMAFGDRLAFFGDDGEHGRQPWVSDGTSAGTHVAAELPPGSTIGWGLGLFAGRWLFSARDSQGWSLWASDGTPSSLSRICQLDVQTSSFPVPLTNLGGTLLFSATNATSGQELWRTDGSAAGTSQVKDILPGPADTFLHPLATIGNQFFFGASDSRDTPYSLWATDGTTAGTRRVPDAFPLESDSSAAAKIGKSLYLSASSPVKTGLFKTDGTAAGTVLLHRLDSDTETAQLAAVRNRLFFFVVNSDTYESWLWTSDGTVAGTKPVSTRHPFRAAIPWAVLGSRLLFTAGGWSGSELWMSDGTVAGTQQIFEGGNGEYPFEASPGVASGFLAVAAGRAFFVGDGGIGARLWVTDGTAHGTRRIGTVFLSAPGLTAVGKQVFFAADDGVHGRELWVSDGTAAGTRMVADIVRGAGSSWPVNLTAVDGLLLFAADDGVHGLEPWVSDGTRKGTRMLQDIAPGRLPSSPTGFRVSGSYVYFSATDAVHGFELWAVAREALAHP